VIVVVGLAGRAVLPSLISPVLVVWPVVGSMFVPVR
jgi:hypothetical protein